MPVSLTTVSDGDPIDYDALRTYTESIEHYINEGIVYGDLKSTAPWVRSTRVFNPDFYTGIVANARLVSGEVHWTRYGHGSYDRSVHHSEVNTKADAGGTAGKYVVVDGMTRTFSVPEAISGGSDPTHRVAVAMDWYCHELGGNGTVDESTDHAADFVLYVNGSPKSTTARPLYTASPGNNTISQFTGVKQYSIRYPVALTTAGVHNIGLRIRMYSHTDQHWRHVFVLGRTATWSWFTR